MLSTAELLGAQIKTLQFFLNTLIYFINSINVEVLPVPGGP